ncbi:MAG: primosomal protein N' [Betaproteobacteria bacterium]|nr:primosomal protein N' [Betaproteobacteria bacterium]
MNVLRVALDVPVATLFDYRTEAASQSDVGRRVVVPFGNKTAVGVIVEVTGTSTIAPGRLKSAVRILREEPGLRAADLRLLAFAADYYHHALGAVVMAALPAPLRRLKARRAQQDQGRLALTAAGADAFEQLPTRATAQRRLLQAVRRAPLDYATIKASSPQASRLVPQFLARGWLRREPPDKKPVRGAPMSVSGPPLTGEQAHAVAEVLGALGRFQPVLLLGITGSGKTEVYLHAMAAALAAGRQALLLVPEISLTPQLEALVGTRFPGTEVVSLHSGLGEGERLANWDAARAGRARIVLGTRLAVFAPIPELGIIIVDEEHDASFKQADGFRYSARDVAVVRARQNNIPVVLGSATPALESYFNATNGRYRLLTLTSRVGSALPQILCIDTQSEKLTEGLTPALLAALERSVTRGEQSMLFLNRRGYAPVLICAACGWMSGCQRCSAKLVLHLKDRRLHCHHCGHRAPVPASCPTCGSPQLAPLGQGTQRVEAALKERFPAARVLRIDRDSVRRRDAWPEMRRRIHQHEVDMLVGTQLLAKGHDFPHLGLVGVINADGVLYSSDFRASERLFALLMQVAGRAGRGATRGTVLIQTRFPQHPVYQALAQQDYRAFAESLLAERRQAGFPPFVYQALLKAEAPKLETALGFLAEASRIGAKLQPRVTLYDAVPAAMPRRAGRERAQLLVQSDARARLQQFLVAWHDALSRASSTRARWSLDVDPLEF